jgi:hypothetical protein
MDRLLCYQTAGGALRNAGGAAAGGDAVCSFSVSDIAHGTVPAATAATLGELFAEQYTAVPWKTRDVPRLQVAASKRLVQRFTLADAAAGSAPTSLLLPIVANHQAVTYPANVCLKNVATGEVLFNTTLANFTSVAAHRFAATRDSDGGGGSSSSSDSSRSSDSTRAHVDTKNGVGARSRSTRLRSHVQTKVAGQGWFRVSLVGTPSSPCCNG